jgi:O-antigen/teichoic acid export membrane protein
MPDELKNKTIQNIGYNSIAKITQIVVSAIASILLTRTLLPSDYGIVGFAGIFISFLSQFGDFGITNAVIRKKDLNNSEIYTAFSLKVCLSIFVFTVAFLFAPLTVRFFDNPAIVPVVRVLALNFVLNCFSFLPNLFLTRDLDFKKISYATLASTLLNSAVSVTLALMGFKYWSIVISGILMTISSAVLLNVYCPVRYRFAYDRDAAWGFIKFGANLFLSGFMIFLIFNADNFLIGAVAGSANLGYYSVAFTWSTMACTIIGSIVLTVLFPTFYKMQEDAEKLKNSYLKVLRYISFGGLLLNMTLFVVSKDLLVLVLGHNTEKWLPALPALRILCAYGVVRLLLEPVGPVIMAIGRTDVIKKAVLLLMVTELGFLYPALRYFGIEGVAVLVTVAYLTQYALYYPVLRSELRVSPGDLVSSVAPALLTVIPFGIFFLISEAFLELSFLGFFTKIVCCTVIYLVSYGLANEWELYKDMRILIRVHV